MQSLLLPRDRDDEKNVIIEVRAGTGGEEAALFASDLFRMYQRYAELHSWRFEVLHFSETGLGGFKEASRRLQGGNCQARGAPRERHWSNDTSNKHGPWRDLTRRWAVGPANFTI